MEEEEGIVDGVMVVVVVGMEEEMEEKMMVEFGVEMVEIVSGKDGSVAGQRRAMAAIALWKRK